jgi:hypothetical protein
LLKVLDQAASFEHLIQARHLDKPTDIVRDELVVDDPFRQLVPLVEVTAVNGQTPLRVLVLALLEIGNEFCGQRRTLIVDIPLVSSARYDPLSRLSVLRKISRRRDEPLPVSVILLALLT